MDDSRRPGRTWRELEAPPPRTARWYVPRRRATARREPRGLDQLAQGSGRRRTPSPGNTSSPSRREVEYAHDVAVLHADQQILASSIRRSNEHLVVGEARGSRALDIATGFWNPWVAGPSSPQTPRPCRRVRAGPPRTVSASWNASKSLGGAHPLLTQASRPRPYRAATDCTGANPSGVVRLESTLIDGGVAYPRYIVGGTFHPPWGTPPETTRPRCAAPVIDFVQRLALSRRKPHTPAGNPGVTSAVDGNPLAQRDPAGLSHPASWPSRGVANRHRRRGRWHSGSPTAQRDGCGSAARASRICGRKRGQASRAAADELRAARAAPVARESRAIIREPRAGRGVPSPPLLGKLGRIDILVNKRRRPVPLAPPQAHLAQRLPRRHPQQPRRHLPHVPRGVAKPGDDREPAARPASRQRDRQTSYRGLPRHGAPPAPRAAGVENMTMTLAGSKWAQFGILVNRSPPGVILSSGTAQVSARPSSERGIQQDAAQSAPARGEEVAAADRVSSPRRPPQFHHRRRRSGSDGGQALWGQHLGESRDDGSRAGRQAVVWSAVRGRGIGRAIATCAGRARGGADRGGSAARARTASMP